MIKTDSQMMLEIISGDKAAENELRDLVKNHAEILLWGSGFKYVDSEVLTYKGRSDLVIYAKKLKSGYLEDFTIIWECKCFTAFICEFNRHRIIPSDSWVSAESQLLEYTKHIPKGISGGIIIGTEKSKANFDDFLDFKGHKKDRVSVKNLKHKFKEELNEFIELRIDSLYEKNNIKLLQWDFVQRLLSSKLDDSNSEVVQNTFFED